MSQEHFKVGEIAIAQHFENFPEYNGAECVVVGALEMRDHIQDDMTSHQAACYKVRFADGMHIGPLPHQLRKKAKPQRMDAVNDEQYLPDLVDA